MQNVIKIVLNTVSLTKSQKSPSGRELFCSLAPHDHRRLGALPSNGRQKKTTFRLGRNLPHPLKLWQHAWFHKMQDRNQDPISLNAILMKCVI